MIVVIMMMMIMLMMIVMIGRYFEVLHDAFDYENDVWIVEYLSTVHVFIYTLIHLPIYLL